jgi:hypothetical protein
VLHAAVEAAEAAAVGPWNAFVMGQIARAAHNGGVTTFAERLRRDVWLLGDAFVWFQIDLIGIATLNGRAAIITALLDLGPALLRRQPPPPSQAIEFVFTCGRTDLLPLLTRIWLVPDDLPHAAGSGDLARVKRWFDAQGNPVLGQSWFLDALLVSRLLLVVAIARTAQDVEHAEVAFVAGVFVEVLVDLP